MNPLVKSSILASGALCLSLGFQLTPAEASENTKSSSQKSYLEQNNSAPKNVNFEELSVEEADGSTSFFATKEDLQLYVTYANLPQKNSAQSYTINSSAKAAIGETVVGTIYKKMKFLGYSKYTPNWVKASTYTLSKGKSDTFSSKFDTKFGDVSASFTRTYGISTTIQANKKKYSKIAGYADLKIQKIKVFLPNMSSSIYKTKAIKQETYVKPKYKK